MMNFKTAMIAVGGIGLAASIAFAGARLWPVGSPWTITNFGGAFTTYTLMMSKHDGTHYAPLPRKYSSIHLVGDTSLGHRKTTIDGHAYIENYSVWGYTETPFCGKIITTGKYEAIWGTRVWSAAEAHGESDWDQSDLVGAENKWRTALGVAPGDFGHNEWGEDEGVADTAVQTGYAAHDSLGSAISRVGGAGEADLLSALVTDLRTGGWLLLDTSGNPQFDANGDLLWDLPPATSLRFTSTVTSATGGGVEYTYRIDNYLDYDFTFHLPEVTTPAFPTGWVGSVDADDFVEITFTETSGEDIYSQRSQSTYTDDDLETLLGTPVRVHVPSSRKGFCGTVAISSVVQTAPTTNEIRFVVSGESADGAVVTRDLDGVGVPSVVEELSGPLTPGNEYIVIDESAPAGAHTYRVRVGVKVNSATSETVQIINQ